MFPANREVEELDFGAFGSVIGVFGLIFAFVILLLVVRAVRKIPYTSPKVGMETLGDKTRLNGCGSFLLNGFEATSNSNRNPL